MDVYLGANIGIFNYIMKARDCNVDNHGLGTAMWKEGGVWRYSAEVADSL
jgi:hypothetical protein